MSLDNDSNTGTEITKFAEKVENKLQERNEIQVFPLTPTHRKELRALRDSNVGDLRTQLQYIKSEKKKEYFSKYEKEVEKDIKKELSTVEKLNDDWYNNFLPKIKKIMEDRKKFEESLNSENLDVDSHWGFLTELRTKEFDNVSDNLRRKFYINISNRKNEILNTEFEENYKNAFYKVSQEIDRLNQAYEEAINFGDLEMVKTLYYKFKDTEKFLEKVRKIQI